MLKMSNIMFDKLNRNCVKSLVEYLKPGGFINVGLTCKQNNNIFNQNITGMFTYLLTKGFVRLCNGCCPNNNAKCIDISHINLCMPLSTQFTEIAETTGRQVMAEYYRAHPGASAPSSPHICLAYPNELIYTCLVDILLPNTWSYDNIIRKSKYQTKKKMTLCNIKHPKDFVAQSNDGIINLPLIGYYNWQIYHFHNAPYKNIAIDKIFGLPLKYHLGPKHKYRSIKALL